MIYMLKKRFYILLFFCLLLGGNVNSSTVDKGDNNAPFENKSTETDYLPIADPFVMLYNNKYYAYGTGGTVSEGFACFSSDDLKNWKREGQALSADDSYGKWGFWAPEVYYIQSKKKFYMFYSVEEHICVATSDSPVGPFRQESKQPIWEEKSIDTSLFIDDDGTPYLYFVRFTDGNVIWVAQMTDDLMKIKKETLSECIKAEEPWELLQAKVAEGPSVLKKKGMYYLIYSANHYQNKGYGVGYATSKSPIGPWTKYDKNPLLQGDEPTGLVGTGHDSYKIDLKNMRTDVAEYQFALDDAFFEAVEGTLVKSGKADADLKIRESGGAYVFTFHIKGTVHVPCDRCLDDMDVEIETERMLTVKLGEEYADEGDMMILPYEDAILNVAWIIYEFIVLEVPLTHVHEPGHCNVEMMEALAAHLVTSSEKPDGSEEEKSADEESDKPVDPRWNKLKKILDNN